MSVLLSCQNIGKSFYSKELFSKLSFGINTGDRVGVIGPNGVGKSTLLKILAGAEPYDEGQLTTVRGLKLVYVAQTEDFPAEETLQQVLMNAGKGMGLDESDLEREVAKIVAKFEFPDTELKVSQLSGGWKKRLSIACGILQQPDLLLMDEPTNHLDIAGVLWLEQLLKRADFSWVVISHDRLFLERTVNRMLEISPIYIDGMLMVEGAYSELLSQRSQYVDEQSNLAQTLRSKVRREVEWLQRGPKARTTKAKSRIDEAHRLQSSLHEVNARMKTTSAQVDFSASDRKTKKLLTATDISIKRDDKCLAQNFSLVLSPGIKLGILGPNGCGKSSLLSALLLELPLASGVIKQADQLKVAYFKQHRDELNEEWTLKRALTEHGDSVIFQDRQIHIATWAKRFQFRPDQLAKPIAHLSGGEKARISIARLMTIPADLLILDEPTNDLDIPTLEILEEALTDFGGAIVMVCHDRYLLSRVCNSFVGFGAEANIVAYADYEQWEQGLRRQLKGNAKGGKKKKGSSASADVAPKKRLSYMDQREYDQMEEKILEAEEAKSLAQTQLDDPDIATMPLKLTEAAKKFEEAQNAVESLYARWAELEIKIRG